MTDSEINIPEQELERIVSAMMKTLEMGICAVYGDEDEDGHDAIVDCESRLQECKARCCTYNFALTKDEVRKGHIRHDPKRPFFIARDSDGYCPHMDRKTYRCLIWETRPLRCRRYNCSDD